MDQEVSAKLDRADFEAALNSEFQMQLAPAIIEGSNTSIESHDEQISSSLPIVLTKCTVKLSNAMQECFSLVFQAPTTAPPMQGMYRLLHPVIGPADIFLVPFKKTEDGLYYEAIFNRLLV
jgi:hypothetical protein